MATPTQPKPLDPPIDAARHIQALLDKGWLWSASDADTLVHPENYDLSLRYNRATGTLSMSPALARQLDLIILTPHSKSLSYWRRPAAN